MLLPALNSARERARFISCASNQKQLGTVLRMYADSEAGSTGNGVMPFAADKKCTSSLQLLRATGQMTDMKMFICPSSTKSAAPGDLGDVKYLSYAYIPGLRDGTSDSGIMADGKSGTDTNNHAFQGNILYADAHVGASKASSSTDTTAVWIHRAGWLDTEGPDIKGNSNSPETWGKTYVGSPTVD